MAWFASMDCSMSKAGPCCGPPWSGVAGIEQYPIVGAVDLRQGIARGHQPGSYIGRDPVVLVDGGGNQLYDLARLTPGPQAFLIELPDAGPRDSRRVDAPVKGQHDQDRQLGGRVVGINVGPGIGLSQPLALCLCQGIGVGRAPGHGMEHGVGRPVQDAGDGIDLVGGERLGQHLHHRDGAGYRGLETQGPQPRQLRPVACDHLLVGRDHLAAGLKRPLDVAPSWLESADQLDDGIEITAPEQAFHGRQRCR